MDGNEDKVKGVMPEDEQAADDWLNLIRDYTQLEELDRRHNPALDLGLSPSCPLASGNMP